MAHDDDGADREAKARALARLEQIARLLGRRADDFFGPAEEDDQDRAWGTRPPLTKDEG